MAEEVLSPEEKKKDYTEIVGTDKVYPDEATAEFAQNWIEKINKGLEKREKASYVTNGVAYTSAYLYNQQKAINYAPPKNPKDDREVSFGLPHEKIIGLAAFFLKYVFKRRIKCHDKNGRIVRGMGDVYDLFIEFSYRLEQFKKLIALIYWEVFTQGNAFVLEEWDVRNCTERNAYKEGKKVAPEQMEYTYEYLEGLSYQKGKDYQTRRAVSRLMDGRQVIFADPEIVEKEDQPWICIEENISRKEAEEVYGSLSRWKFVPTERDSIDKITGSEKTTLFDSKRLEEAKNQVLVHRLMAKEGNHFNLYLNGVMMLPKDTPFMLFWPRNHYPLTNIAGERLTGSIYARSIPAKTKFNADYIDWVLKMMALKFEQGIIPAILSKGKYTLTRDIFRAGQVTHGITSADYEKADPENKGLTTQEFSFAKFLKEIIEGQSLNTTTSGEISQNTTATEIQNVQANQIEKLGFLMDGLMLGFMDMALARAYTIESKYTTQTDETVVDGKKIPVYQNFTVTLDGVDNEVSFDEAVGSESYPEQETRDRLFQEAFQEKRKGYRTEKYLVNPKALRERRYSIDVEIKPERVKDVQSELIQMFDEFGKLVQLFQGRINMDEMQKEYLQITGRPGELFLSAEMARLNAEASMQGVPTDQYDMGTNGRTPAMKPTMKPAMRQMASTR